MRIVMDGVLVDTEVDKQWASSTPINGYTIKSECYIRSTASGKLYFYTKEWNEDTEEYSEKVRLMNEEEYEFYRNACDFWEE